MKSVLWLGCSGTDVSVWHLSMYGFVSLLTKAVFTQMVIFLFTVRETQNISAQVVSLLLVFLAWLSLLLLDFYIGMAEEIFLRVGG